MTIPKWMYEQPIAHRGLHNQSAPENSMAAFSNAIEKNYAVEMDVQILGDGMLVVFHDFHLKRMTGYDKALKDVTYDEIKSLTLFETQETIPTFQNFLKFIDGRIPLVIEFKNESTSTKMEEKAYEMLKSYKGSFVVQSFNPLSINWFRKNAPSIIRGQLSYDYKKDKTFFINKWFLRNVYGNIITRPHYVMYDIKALESNVIKRLRSQKMPLFSYTAKSKVDYEYAKRMNIPACFEGFDLE